MRRVEDAGGMVEGDVNMSEDGSVAIPGDDGGIVFTGN